MLIFAPDDLRAALVEEFRLKNVPHEPRFLATLSPDSGSVATLMVEGGLATAAATTVTVAWWAQRRTRLHLVIVLDDGRGQRRQINIGTAKPDTVPLLFAQAKEVIIEAAISKRKAVKAKRVKLPSLLRTTLLDEVRSCCPN